MFRLSLLSSSSSSRVETAHQGQQPATHTPAYVPVNRQTAFLVQSPDQPEEASKIPDKQTVEIPTNTQQVSHMISSDRSSNTTPAVTMATLSVCVRLYYKREERFEMQDNLIDIWIAEMPNGNISGLTRRLKEVDMENDLRHCDRGRIHVYRPGSAPPYSEANSFPPGRRTGGFD